MLYEADMYFLTEPHLKADFGPFCCHFTLHEQQQVVGVAMKLRAV